MSNELKQLEKDKRKAISLSQWKEAAAACNCIGTEYERMGQYEEALASHVEEMNYYEMLGDQLGLGIAHRRIGECYTLMHKYKKAFSHIESFLEIAISLNNKIEEQRAWATLGRTYFLKYSSEADAHESEIHCLKTLDRAEHAYLKALDLSEIVKTKLNSKEYAEMKARVLLNLGLVRELRGDIPQCAENIRQAIFLASKFDLYEDLHRCETSLAGVYQKHGQYNLALRLLDKAILSAEKLTNKTLLCDALCSKANILILLKDFEGGKNCLVRAYKVHSLVEDDHVKITQNLKVCVGLCQAQKKLQACEDDETERKLLLEKIADGLSAFECYKLAIDYYLLTLKVMEENNYSVLQKAPIYFSLAVTYHDAGNLEKALEYLKLEFGCNESKPNEQIKTLWKIAEYLEETQDRREQEKVLHQALSLAEKLENEKLVYNSLSKLLELYTKNNMSEEAERINLKVKNMTLLDEFNSESETEEDTQGLFDIRLSELSELGESDTENNTTLKNRSKRQTRKYVNKVNEKGETSLQQACINGNFTVVKRLVESGHPINVRDFCGWTPLHEACNHGFYDIAEYLLDNGAFINDRGGSQCGGITPLHDAASCGHIDIMKLLISRGASVTILNDKGETPLHELLRWREEMQNDLDKETTRACRQIEEELRSKMAQAGQPAQDASTYIDPIDNDVPQASTSYDNYQARTSEKRARSSSSSSSHISDNEYVAPYLNADRDKDWDDAQEVKSEYAAVMSSFRRSSKPAPVKISPPKTSTKSPLLNEGELVTEWLIKDTNHAPKAKKKRRKPRLNVRKSKSICNYLVRDDDISTDSNDLDNITIDDPSLGNDNGPQAESFGAPINVTNNTSESTRRGTSATAFCLKVRIDDKVILVPIPNDSCTVSWLAEEAAERYRNLVGRRPVLILTRGIEHLGEKDAVKSIFNNNEEVIATIQDWEKVPLSEYYEQICNKKNAKSLDSVKDRLTNCDTNAKLDFSNCMLSPMQVNLIFLTLSSFKNLRDLNLSGIKLTDDSSDNIVKCLPCFTSLISIRMCCCGLSVRTLKSIAEVIHSTENILPNLMELFLGKNMFWSECSSYLANILQLPSLTILDLNSCDLIPSTFENIHLCQVLKSCTKLEELNISENVLSVSSIDNILSNLPRNNLKKINMSYTTKKALNLGDRIHNFLSGGMPKLKDICLKDCYLKDNDLTLLSKSLQYCPELKSCNISANPNLSTNAIVSFLQLCAHNPSLAEVSVTGTCEWDATNITCLVNIIREKRLNHVSLDCIPEALQEEIIRSWENNWGSKARYIAYDFCQLTIE